jgi:hypothetical protein
MWIWYVFFVTWVILGFAAVAFYETHLKSYGPPIVIPVYITVYAIAITGIVAFVASQW